MSEFLRQVMERLPWILKNAMTWLSLCKELLTMAASKERKGVQPGPVATKRDSTPDDFPDDLSGDFASLPRQTVENIGTIAGLAVAGGGYFGISVTDDGGSVRLAVRNGTFVLDKRFSTIAKFEGALAYCLRKLE